MTPAVILLHGFTHTGASWDPVVAALGERYRSLAPDIRGHGAATGVEPITLADVLADIEALTEGPFSLAGYSMGGRIALHLALREPARVQRLVLIGASPGLDDPRERAARAAADEQLAGEIERSSIEEFAGRWAQDTPVLAGQPPAVQNRARADRLRNTTAGLGRALRALGAGALPPVWDRLGELAMPVTLIAGERDQKFTAIARRMAVAIDDVRLAVVPGAGHAVHLENPEAVGRVL